MKHFLKKNYILILITLTGFIIRIAGITQNPPSLNWDEVSHGYNAYSILQTGRDEWGTFLPTIFPAFGDYKLPLYIYLTVPFVAFFGLNALSVRLVSVLAGTLAIPAICLLTNKLFANKKLSILNLSAKSASFQLSVGEIAGFTLALLPWHIFISRPALEANLALTFIITGLYFLLKKSFIPASIFLSLSLHTYNTSRLFIPLVLISWFFIYRPKLKITKKNAISLIILFFAGTMVLYQVFMGTGIARYSQISLLSEHQVYVIGEDRANSTLPGILPRLIYNRPVQVSKMVALKYLEHFTPSFIYQSNGANNQFSIPNTNMLTWPIITAYFIGLFFTLKNIKQKNSLFLLALLFLSPLADSLTIDPAHALRSSIMIPALVIISSLGIFYVNSKTKFKKLILLIFAITLILSTVNYWKKYDTEYKNTYSASWQYGYQQVISYINENQNNYSRIIFSKRYAEPHIFYAFYAKLAPQDLWTNGDNIRFTQSNWRWTDKIGKVFFVNDWIIPQDLPSENLTLESGSEIETKNSLLITSPDHVPSNTEILKEISFLDGSPAFVIARFK